MLDCSSIALSAVRSTELAWLPLSIACLSDDACVLSWFAIAIPEALSLAALILSPVESLSSDFDKLLELLVFATTALSAATFVTIRIPPAIVNPFKVNSTEVHSVVMDYIGRKKNLFRGRGEKI